MCRSRKAIRCKPSAVRIRHSPPIVMDRGKIQFEKKNSKSGGSMKKVLKLTSLFCLLLCGIAFLSACDLSHKHYLDNYGVCKNCKEDTAEVLTRNSNLEYISSERNCNVQETYAFFKFVANGEEMVKIIVEEISTEYQEVRLLNKNANSVFLIPKENNTFLYEGTLTAGEIYYVRVKLKDSGKIRVTVSPYVSDVI